MPLVAHLTPLGEPGPERDRPASAAEHRHGRSHHAVRLDRDRDPVEAERLFGEAIEIARTQGSAGHHLRAALGLATLLQALGRGAEAADVVRPAREAFRDAAPEYELVQLAAFDATIAYGRIERKRH